MTFRGDEELDLATPYTRGSTLFVQAQKAHPSGYPVHAGIDPITRLSPNNFARLPRTRGDRPFFAFVIQFRSWATPYTRGSTRFGNPVKLF